MTSKDFLKRKHEIWRKYKCFTNSHTHEITVKTQNGMVHIRIEWLPRENTARFFSQTANGQYNICFKCAAECLNYLDNYLKYSQLKILLE
jgi:hypothetical protein